MWDILEENIFDEAVHIDKSQILFNALTKKGQLITVCLRAIIIIIIIRTLFIEGDT